MISYSAIRAEGAKFRVVFDASSKDCQGISLNDCLLSGSKLQRNLVSILLRYRLYSVCFTMDVKQMFRQILVSTKHCDFQRILWRFSPSDPIQDYRLLTVTYGVSSSPFLAIATLLHLAKLYENKYPQASKVL